MLEYAAWANELSEGQIQQIAKEYFETREELAEKDFHDAFRDMFDVSEIDELPSLNQKLRLFIVAEEIPASVVRVCRFLRTSHGLDLSCISISTFQTESGEEKLVSMEIKVGAEGIITPKTKRQRHSHSTQWSEDKPVKEVLWEAVQELTGENINVEFTLEEVREIISKKYPNFKPATLRGVMNANRVNDPAPNNHFVVNPDGKYWWIKRGTYRLYNPESDGIETDEEINLSESTVEHST